MLVYVQSYGFTHSVARRRAPGADSYVDARLRLWADADPRLEVVVSQDADMFHPVKLMDFDAVFFYTTGELPLDEPAKRALMDFIRDGGGFVGSHCATDTFYQWKDYGLMLGGYFNGHPWTQEVGVIVENTDHPATRMLGESFTVFDEIYTFKDWDRGKTQVLMRIDNDSVDVAKGNRDDNDYA